MNILCIKIAEQSFRGRTYTHPLLQRIQTAMSYPGYLRGKAFHMILFLLKQAFRDKQRHIYVLHTCLLKTAIQLLLNIFPNCIASWLNYHTALYTCIVTQLCFLHHIGIPLGKIYVHRCDGFYQFLFLCHNFLLMNKKMLPANFL